MALIPPLDWHDEKEHRRKLGWCLQGLMDGRTNNAGSVTLTASTVTTVVSDRRAGVDSVVVFMPTTSNAAIVLDRLYISARTDGAFTITHASTTSTDMSYEYALLATGGGSG
jgi:hypothetical protein